MGRKVNVDGVNFQYTNCTGEEDSPEYWVALCLCAHTIDLTWVPEEEGIKIEEFNVHSLGIHLKINGRDYFLKGQKVDAEEDLFRDRKN